MEQQHEAVIGGNITHLILNLEVGPTFMLLLKLIDLYSKKVTYTVFQFKKDKVYLYIEDLVMCSYILYLYTEKNKQLY